jgi:hypothetical protein
VATSVIKKSFNLDDIEAQNVLVSISYNRPTLRRNHCSLVAFLNAGRHKTQSRKRCSSETRFEKIAGLKVRQQFSAHGTK